MITGSNRPDAYFVALDRAIRAAPASTSRVESVRSRATTTHQAAALMRNKAIASYVAKAPRY
jgi:hypothetical protein